MAAICTGRVVFVAILWTLADRAWCTTTVEPDAITTAPATSPRPGTLRTTTTPTAVRGPRGTDLQAQLASIQKLRDTLGK